MKIIANIFGIGAMIFLFSIYQQKSRKNMLMCKLSADICWSVHYACLGAFAGIIPNFTGIFRELVFVNRKEKKWANSLLWPMIFILINIALGVRSFGNWYDVLPIVASSFVTVSLWIDNPNLTKIISFPVSAAFLTYDVFVASHIGIVNESLSMISILIYFIKNFKESKNHD